MLAFDQRVSCVYCGGATGGKQCLTLAPLRLRGVNAVLSLYYVTIKSGLFCIFYQPSTTSHITKRQPDPVDELACFALRFEWDLAE